MTVLRARAVACQVTRHAPRTATPGMHNWSLSNVPGQSTTSIIAERMRVFGRFGPGEMGAGRYLSHGKVLNNRPN
jgi:hypothetical protein